MSTPTPSIVSNASPQPANAQAGNELAGVGAEHGQRPLNAMDCAMLSVSRELKNSGYSGFETQALVWLRGCVDETRLERVLTLLARKFPAVTSRLAGVDKTVPDWRYRPGAVCPLNVVTLDSADDEAIWDCASQLLSTPRDLEQQDPISFHLLRSPGRGDVFVMQYSHAVMDNNAASYVLDELNQLWSISEGETEEATTKPIAAREGNPQPDTLEQPSVEMRDALAAYLSRFSRKQRWRAAWRTIDLRFRKLRGQPLTIGGTPQGGEHSRAYRILSRSLDADATSELQRRVVDLCGFPAMSMGILASVFRSLVHVNADQSPAEARLRLSHTDEQHDRSGEGRERTNAAGRGTGRRESRRNRGCRRRRLIAGIGVDLGLRGKQGPVFQNLVSLMPVAADPSELHDRDTLIRSLHYQIRDRLAQDADLGFIQLANVGRVSRRLVRWATVRLLKHAYSMWYAYFGTADDLVDGFCGVAVNDLCFTGPTWSPLGVTLIVNRFRNRLHFQGTYLPDVVPSETVERFLDCILTDLSH